jgi:DNA-binding LacI/PurR family transcriptional regulator
LAEQFQTTTVRVQKALDLLINEGIVRARGCLGTFVSDVLPATQLYALTFPASNGELNSHFYRTIQSEAAKRAVHRVFEIFYGIDVHVNEPDYRHLEEKVRAHAVAGIIFGAFPRSLGNSPIVREPSVPRVLIQGGRASQSVPSVYPDTDSFLPRAFNYLAGCGRKRVAVVSLVGTWGGPPGVVELQVLAEQAGLEMRPEWLQGVSTFALPWGEQVGRLLFSLNRAQRPDALVIADDNLVPAVTTGVQATGIKVPRDLVVVAQANFPSPTPSAVPAIRLGYDVGRLLDLCLERLEQQRRGEVPEMHTVLPPVFEDELNK